MASQVQSKQEVAQTPLSRDPDNRLRLISTRTVQQRQSTSQLASNIHSTTTPKRNDARIATPSSAPDSSKSVGETPNSAMGIQSWRHPTLDVLSETARTEDFTEHTLNVLIYNTVAFMLLFWLKNSVGGLHYVHKLVSTHRLAVTMGHYLRMRSSALVVLLLILSNCHPICPILQYLYRHLEIL